MATENLNRLKVIELSKIARELQQTDCYGMTINEILIEQFYKTDGHEEFNTFWEWLKLGKKVKKGSKAFAVWGKKKTVKSQESENTEENDEYKFYPICYLFSNLQVEPNNTPAGVEK